MIELANVSKHAGEKCILHDINVSFRRGELTFVVGTSGAGKTTLLNIIGGLDCPDSGDVVYDGKSVLNAKVCTIMLHLYEIEEEIRKYIHVLPFLQKETQKA